MASPVELLSLLPETVPYNPKKQHIIDHSGMVNKMTYQILVGVFTAIATIAAMTRLAIHLKYRRKLFIDDYLVMFATACLLVQTGILYKYCPMIYIISVVTTDPLGYTLFTRGELLALAGMLKWSNIFVCFAWTVNYTIKLSFLAFFWTLVRDVSQRLTRYWWFVLCFVGISWLFNMIENFIICGANNSYKCYPSPRFMVEMTVATSLADILSDLMIISIPIIILNKSQMRISQKLRILPFLCLNVFMATFCLIRIAGKYTDPQGTMQVHVEWTTLTLHMESSVAVLMGGVTAFRTLFASRIRERQHQEPEFGRGSSSLYSRLRKLFNRGNSSRTLEIPQTDNGKSMLSGIKVGGTLSGLRTFIRRHKREPGHTTVEEAGSWDDSVTGSVYNYHAFKREEKRDMEIGSDRALTLKTKGTGVSSEAQFLPERPSPVLQTHNMV